VCDEVESIHRSESKDLILSISAKYIYINLGAEWLLSVNLSLIKNEKTKLAQEFLKLVPMIEIEQKEICVSLLHLLESKVGHVLNFNLITLNV